MVAIHQGITNPALLAAIAANPDDDLPRLVYADWLDENGQPERAEFIRVSCREAELKRENPHPTKEWAEVWRKLKLLQAAIAANDWFPCTKCFPKPPRRPTNVQKKNYSQSMPSFTWDRGFITAVQCRLQGWLWWGRTLFARHPTITLVAIADKRPLQVTINGMNRFMWINNESHSYEDRAADPVLRLPKDVFEILIPDHGEVKGDRTQCYSSLPAAVGKLSDTLILYARR